MKQDFINVGKIFDTYKVIHVPYYQRDYVWGIKNDGRNLYKFIDDIFTQYNTNPQSEYFIGTLAFCSEKVNDVIDGQQRLTSLILILSILAQEKCSEEIQNRNKQLIEPDGTFVIQEEFYLTEELKFNLGLENNFKSQGYHVDISKTKDKIKSQIIRAWGENTTNWYDGLYNYILEKVMLISLEYSNIGDSLKYFLNINSLSIQLTQSDIFYSILSQSLRISRNNNSIFSIKQKIAELAAYQGLNKDIEDYKAYDQNSDKAVDNIIYIFLNAHFQGDNDIPTLNATGIGKWLSFYKNEVFNDQLEAKEFTEKFLAYIKDFEEIYQLFSNMKKTEQNSSIYLSWILLKYENYFDILKMLTELFRTRHNYKTESLYNFGTNNLSLNKIEEIAKRLNLTLIWNYIRSSNKRLDGFITNIALSSEDNYKRSVEDIYDDIVFDEIFNLNYNDKKNVSSIKTKDFSRIIKVILALQQSLLSSVANTKKDINVYLQDILLTANFDIEHLYSVKEYQDKTRLKVWQEKKNMFHADIDFDTERFKFENLSLLNSSTNRSLGEEEISNKLSKYKIARNICNSEWEYLIQSLVEDSEFYKNDAISKLNLPKRTLQNIEQNTWELSENNRDFNIKLLELALKEIAKKGSVKKVNYDDMLNVDTSSMAAEINLT